MRTKTILGVAAVSIGALAFASAAQAGDWRRHRGHHHGYHHGLHHHAGQFAGQGSYGYYAPRAPRPRAYAPAYGYAAPSYGYAPRSYGYAPVARTWQRSYAVPTTVYQPVTTTSYVPVQSTRYVPMTAYRQVTQTCSCTIDGVTTQVPCAGGYGGYGYPNTVRGLSYNRPGLFTSGW